MGMSRIQESFTKNRPYEVAAMITIKKTAPTSKGATLLETIFNFQTMADPLLLRRAWYAADSTKYQQDFLDSLTVFKDMDRVQKIYAALSASDSERARAVLVEESAIVSDNMVPEIPDVMRVNLSPDNTRQQIDLQVPFVRLSSFLKKASEVLDKNCSGHITRVTIAHTPIHGGRSDSVRALLDYNA